MVDHIDLLDLSKTYTYADYLTWRFEDRLELIKGKVFKMSPAPRRIHQKVSRLLTKQLENNINESDCELYFAPFDVRLSDKKKDEDQILTVVQPDICIICDQEKLDDKGCIGAPDLIVEILSPSTMKKDVQDKFDLYEENKVREYWIVHVDEKLVELFYLKNSKYLLQRIYTAEDRIKSVIFPEMIIDLTKVFLK